MFLSMLNRNIVSTLPLSVEITNPRQKIYSNYICTTQSYKLFLIHILWINSLSWIHICLLNLIWILLFDFICSTSFTVYHWPLNNMSLKCVGPVLGGFFSISTVQYCECIFFSLYFLSKIFFSLAHFIVRIQ